MAAMRLLSVTELTEPSGLGLDEFMPSASRAMAAADSAATALLELVMSWRKVGMAMVAKTAKITTAMISSSRVKPPRRFLEERREKKVIAVTVSGAHRNA